MNLDSLEALRGEKRTNDKATTASERQLTEAERKELRRQANRERDRRIMESAAEVIQLDEKRMEQRRKLGLEDEESPTPPEE
jgi:hypothetical protein